MPIDVRRLDVRRFAAEKMQKLNVFETSRFFCDVYCLEPGQAQKPHAHEDADKMYAVLEGAVQVTIGDETRDLITGDAVLAPAGLSHGVTNNSGARASLLVFMAPHP